MNLHQFTGQTQTDQQLWRYLEQNCNIWRDVQPGRTGDASIYPVYRHDNYVNIVTELSRKKLHKEELIGI